MSKKPKPLTTEQRLDLLKSLGHGFVEMFKANKVFAYGSTSLALLALGKARIVPCGAVEVLQGVNTYIAISDVVEEGDTGFFGVGGMAELAAKGGSSILIGDLWGKLVNPKGCPLIVEGVPTITLHRESTTPITDILGLTDPTVEFTGDVTGTGTIPKIGTDPYAKPKPAAEVSILPGKGSIWDYRTWFD